MLYAFLLLLLFYIRSLTLDTGLGWVVRLRPVIRMCDLGLLGILSSVEDFLRYYSPYLPEFRRKTRKIPNG